MALGNTLLNADLLIAKDILMHLPNSDVFYFLSNILPKLKCALITHDSYDGLNQNEDIITCVRRPIDLTCASFNFNYTKLVLHYEA